MIVACTYYVNTPKLKVIGKDQELSVEEVNRKAIRLAFEVRNEKGNEHCLVCGDISNSTVYVIDDPKSHEIVLNMFREQARWAKEEGVDFILAETINSVGEALLAL